MKKLFKNQLLSKREASVILRHVSEDISYEEGGSFSKDGKNAEILFNRKEAKIAKGALFKIQEHLTQ